MAQASLPSGTSMSHRQQVAQHEPLHAAQSLLSRALAAYKQVHEQIHHSNTSAAWHGAGRPGACVYSFSRRPVLMPARADSP